MVSRNFSGKIHLLGQSENLKDIADLGGKALLNQPGNSIPTILSVVYPEHEWLPWKFDSCPRHFWTVPANQRKFMDWAAKELNIKDMSDWYNITYQVYYIPSFF